MYNQSFIEDLIAKRNLLLDQVQHIEAIISFASVDPINYSSSDTSKTERKLVSGEKMPYNRDDSYQKKIAGILKQYSRFLSISEMANIVNAFEAKISLEEAKKGLGSAKNLLLKQGTLTKVQVGTNNSNTFYGSVAWLDENMQPKPEHMYDENALQVKQTILI
ncbi:hypothetical protein A0256_11350 [Mucilaginibacter sp. PAMC 26640]|nr:hypothetical protein A0256_11350 [Mucilaginibacter sp. PAMC 26640]